MMTMKRILILFTALFAAGSVFAQSEYNLRRRTLFEVSCSITATSRTAASAATVRGGCSNGSTRSSRDIPKSSS